MWERIKSAHLRCCPAIANIIIKTPRITNTSKQLTPKQRDRTGKGVECGAAMYNCIYAIKLRKITFLYKDALS